MGRRCKSVPFVVVISGALLACQVTLRYCSTAFDTDDVSPPAAFADTRSCSWRHRRLVPGYAR
jgi:hypothetical protein